MKVAIQGIKGSFHHIVAQRYFNSEIEIVESLTFSNLPNVLKSNQADVAIMAIENTIAGAILPNYNLIDANKLQVIGEYYLPISHHFLCSPNTTLNEIKEVHSHPMALLQCHEFFKKHPQIQLVEAKDTALVAKQIAAENPKDIGAIASAEAATTYNLKFLAKNIQTMASNATRFFVISNQKEEIKGVNKASLKFVASHKKGSLAEILTVLGNHNLNLSKIQSLPVIDEPWKYAFFIDVVFKEYNQYKKALNNIKTKILSLSVLGEYKKSKR
ncbi:MAG TPA: prephenate dehydratase [Flavobacteriaceae bacterium]|nr:prephenate dehydratase [Flavobacteriaceae bacterium]